MKVVFIHGRSQEAKNPAELQKAWSHGLASGFASIGLTYTSTLDTVFPYYGDLLFGLTDRLNHGDAVDLIDRGEPAVVPSAEERKFIQDVIFDMVESKGIDLRTLAAEPEEAVERGVQNWPAVLAAVRMLDRIHGLAETSIERYTRDVWYYLTEKGLRLRINEIVSKAVPKDEPCAIVAHSLGTIVAYNLLMDLTQRSNIRALITIGSPLGIKAIYDRLPSDSPPRAAPDGVPIWYNARDKRDLVALYEIDPTLFAGAPQVTNYNDVDNASENRHGIIEYLQDTAIARTIYEVIKA